MDSILITGGTGFIGSHTCVSLLEDNYNLYVIDSNINSSIRAIDAIKKIFEGKENNISEKLKFFKGDIRDSSFLKKVFLNAEKDKKPIRSVIHFAGLKSVKESIDKPILYWDFNVCGTLSLLEVMGQYNCNTIVFSSSATIYGQNSNIPIKESDSVSPVNPYGNTKASIESILKSVFLSEKNTWRIANLRYFNPIGAHSSGFIGEDPLQEPNNLFPYICRVAKGIYPHLNIFGNNWSTSDGTGIRDYIHVMDVADSHKIVLELLNKNKSQYINLNIGTGKGTSVLELVNTFQKINHCYIPYEFVERRPGDIESVIANNHLAKTILDWEPIRNIEEMCEDGWRWQVKNPNGFLDL